MKIQIHNCIYIKLKKSFKPYKIKTIFNYCNEENNFTELPMTSESFVKYNTNEVMIEFYDYFSCNNIHFLDYKSIFYALNSTKQEK